MDLDVEEQRCHREQVLICPTMGLNRALDVFHQRVLKAIKPYATEQNQYTAAWHVGGRQSGRYVSLDSVMESGNAAGCAEVGYVQVAHLDDHRLGGSIGQTEAIKRGRRPCVDRKIDMGAVQSKAIRCGKRRKAQQGKFLSRQVRQHAWEQRMVPPTGMKL
jgi:hypothetical protein